MKKFDTIYKRTSTGATQIWYQEISDDGTSYRSVSGQIDGKKTTSAFKACQQKNVGKANETSLQEQCVLEVEANYKKKLAQGNYKESLDEKALGKDNFFKPMLAHVYHKKYKYNSADNLFSQGKLDGIRCIATKDGLFSREGKPIVSAPHISEALTPIFTKYPDLILDGELYADKLSDNFNDIISLARQAKPTEEDFARSREVLQYWLYDLFSTAAYETRYNKLSKLVNELDSPSIKLVIATKVRSEEHMDQLYADAMANGYEGQMIRVSNKGYENKRANQLLKRKEFIDEEFTITDLIEGEGNWAGYAKSVIFRLNDATERTSDAGVAGNQAFTKELLENKEDYIGTLVTIKYQNLTPVGKPRFAIATKFLKTKVREL